MRGHLRGLQVAVAQWDLLLGADRRAAGASVGMSGKTASREARIMRNAIATFAAAMFGCVLATAAIAQVTENGGIATYTAPTVGAGTGIDYANAQPLRMPLANVPPNSQWQKIDRGSGPAVLFGPAQVSPGSVGSGEEAPVRLAPPQTSQQHNGVVPQQNGAVPELYGVMPEQFGTAELPFTTERVNAVDHSTVKFSPFRAAGKLFFNKGAASLTCSAALIKRGVVVTAAHCVANYGKNEIYSNFDFVPAFDDGNAPFGHWAVESTRVVQRYLDGTDACDQAGVVCPDDVAVLTLKPQSGQFAGAKTGWFAYAVNGVGFTAEGEALIKALSTAAWRKTRSSDR
jgi:V8-like Glu-specific endopeptidase